MRVLLQTGTATVQQGVHLDTHQKRDANGGVTQVQDACSILGYTGPRVLEVLSTNGVFEQVSVQAGDIVVMMANTTHRGTISGGDDSPLLFMYWDRSYKVQRDRGLYFAPVGPITPESLRVKSVPLHKLLATMREHFK